MVRPIRLEVPVQNVVGYHRPFAIALGLSTAPGPRSEGIEPHQPFDPMKPAVKPFLENIAPDAARAIGPVAGLEARLDRRDELGVRDLTGAGWPVEPGVEARSETSRALHSQLTGQMWRCSAMKANPMSPRARKKLPLS